MKYIVVCATILISTYSSALSQNSEDTVLGEEATSIVKDILNVEGIDEIPLPLTDEELHELAHFRMDEFESNDQLGTHHAEHELVTTIIEDENYYCECRFHLWVGDGSQNSRNENVLEYFWPTRVSIMQLSQIDTEVVKNIIPRKKILGFSPIYANAAYLKVSNMCEHK